MPVTSRALSARSAARQDAPAMDVVDATDGPPRPSAALERGALGEPVRR